MWVSKPRQQAGKRVLQRRRMYGLKASIKRRWWLEPIQAIPPISDKTPVLSRLRLRLPLQSITRRLVCLNMKELAVNWLQRLIVALRLNTKAPTVVVLLRKPPFRSTHHISIALQTLSVTCTEILATSGKLAEAHQPGVMETTSSIHFDTDIRIATSGGDEQGVGRNCPE